MRKEVFEYMIKYMRNLFDLTDTDPNYASITLEGKYAVINALIDQYLNGEYIQEYEDMYNNYLDGGIL